MADYDGKKTILLEKQYLYVKASKGFQLVGTSTEVVPTNIGYYRFLVDNVTHAIGNSYVDVLYFLDDSDFQAYCSDLFLENVQDMTTLGLETVNETLKDMNTGLSGALQTVVTNQSNVLIKQDTLINDVSSLSSALSTSLETLTTNQTTSINDLGIFESKFVNYMNYFNLFSRLCVDKYFYSLFCSLSSDPLFKNNYYDTSNSLFSADVQTNSLKFTIYVDDGYYGVFISSDTLVANPARWLIFDSNFLSFYTRLSENTTRKFFVYSDTVSTVYSSSFIPCLYIPSKHCISFGYTYVNSNNALIFEFDSVGHADFLKSTDKAYFCFILLNNENNRLRYQRLFDFYTFMNSTFKKAGLNYLDCIKGLNLFSSDFSFIG